MKNICKILGIYILSIALCSFALNLPFAFLSAANIEIKDVKIYTLAGATVLAGIITIRYALKKGFFTLQRNQFRVVSCLLLILLIPLFVAFGISIDLLSSCIPPIPDMLVDFYPNFFSNPVGILIVIFFAPFFEEIIFRGIIQGELQKKYSPVKAILISAAIFGITHINPSQIASAFFAGLLLGWLYYKTKSLLIPMIVHFFYNFLCTIIYLHTGKQSTLSLFEGRINLILLFILCIITFAVCCYTIINILKREKPSS